ncbi:hypothetical protein F5I97DRAFT_1800789 [Phlebopus sp. FC_14]|nr:hypothetical protein F5I97DRAFT_1800789 [Phlebopus sp. FC_14]
MSSEAFVILTLPQATLSHGGTTQSGSLEVECLSLAVQRGKSPDATQEVYLIVRLNGLEKPVDPSRPITFALTSSGRSYVFSTADGSTATLMLPPSPEPLTVEDQDTFHGILAQYAEFIEPGQARYGEEANESVSHEAPRGRLILVDENNGEVVGELDSRLRVNEEASLAHRGTENDPVVIEIADENAQEIFARAVPPEDRDWITQSASLVSHVISGTTNLLLTTMTSASSYYIKHSKPHTSSSSDGNSTTPPRALVFLTSEKAQKGLSTVHALSGRAATVSHKTVSLVDEMVRRTVGRKKKSTQAASSSAAGIPAPPLPPRSPGLNATANLPPPYAYSSGEHLSTLKPPLPPRSVSPQPKYSESKSIDSKPALPPRTDGRIPSPQSYASTSAQSPGSRPPLRMRHRLLLSADLILSTMDSSMKQVVSVGGETLGRAVEHKYGVDAARSAGFLTGATKNIVAVYIDMRGIGRRAIIKRAGKEFVKARLSSRPSQ